jgi:hypothetical protein
MLICNDQHAVAGHIKNTGDGQLRTPKTAAIAMALARLELAACGAYAQTAPHSQKNENVVIVSPI